MDKDEVLDASMQSGATMPSSCLKRSHLTSRRSTTASTTRSARLMVCKSEQAATRASDSAACCSDNLPLAASLPHICCKFSLAASMAWAFRSNNSTSRPACAARSEEHTSELQSLMRISYAVFCLKTKTNKQTTVV